MFIQKLPVGLMVLATATPVLTHASSWDLALKSTEQARARANRSELSTPPVKGVISSSFGNRVNPITQRHSEHKGIDIAAAEGTPIHSAQMGRVTFAGDAGTYGKLVEIRHIDGTLARYAHASAVDVQVGQRVHKGEQLGRVGATGSATGPHLHYELIADGRHIDPAAVAIAGLVGKQEHSEQKTVQEIDDIRQNETLIASLIQTHSSESILAGRAGIDVSDTVAQINQAGSGDSALVAKLVPFVPKPLPDPVTSNVFNSEDFQSRENKVFVDSAVLKASIAELRQSIIQGLV